MIPAALALTLLLPAPLAYAWDGVTTKQEAAAGLVWSDDARTRAAKMGAYRASQAEAREEARQFDADRADDEAYFSGLQRQADHAAQMREIAASEARIMRAIREQRR